jgi:transcriptional regulator with XRE-family HTH domain
MSSEKNERLGVPSGKAIRKALIDIDQTPLELARAMGVSVIYIRYLMNERRDGAAIRKRIAAYLGEQLRKRGCYLPMWARKEKAA